MESFVYHQNQLIKSILLISDIQALNSIESFISKLSNKRQSIKLNDEIKNSILQSQKEILEGNFYIEDEINKMDLTWLNEK